MSKTYLFVVADDSNESELNNVNRNQASYAVGMSPALSEIFIAEDEVSRTDGISVDMPYAVLQMKRIMVCPTLLDSALITQIEALFANRSSDGIIITATELSEFLKNHQDKFIICIGV